MRWLLLCLLFASGSFASVQVIDRVVEQCKRDGNYTDDVANFVARLRQEIRELEDRPGFFRRTLHKTSSVLTVMNVLYFAGGLVVVFSMTLLFGLCAGMGAGGLLFITAAYQWAFLAMALHAYSGYQGEYRVVAGILATVSVCLMPLVTYAIQTMLNLWGKGRPNSDDFFRIIDEKWIPMEVTTCIYSFFLCSLMPFSFLMLPVGFCLWFLSMDLAPYLVRAQTYSYYARSWVSFFTGIAIMILGTFIQVHLVDAFWIFFFGGLALLAGGFIVFEDEANETGVLFLLTSVGLIVASTTFGQEVLFYFGVLFLVIIVGVDSYQSFVKRPPSLFYSIVRLSIALAATVASRQLGIIPLLAGCLVWVFFLLSISKCAISGQNEIVLIIIFAASWILALTAPIFDDVHMVGTWICLVMAYGGFLVFHGLGELRKDSRWYLSYRMLLSFVVLSLGSLVPDAPYGMFWASGGVGVIASLAGLRVYRRSTSLLLLLIAPISLYTYFAFESGEILFYLTAVLMIWTHTHALRRKSSGFLFDCYAALISLAGIMLNSQLILGVGGYMLAWKLGEWVNHFRDSLVFPFALTFVGMAIIGSGILVQKYQDFVRELILSYGDKIFQYQPESLKFGISGEFLDDYFKDSPDSPFYLGAFSATILALCLLRWIYIKFLSYPTVDPSTSAACTVTSFQVRLAKRTENHGIEFVIEGKKPADLAFHAAELHIVSDSWWKTIERKYGTLVTFGKAALYPISLCDTRMSSADFAKGQTTFKTILSVGTGRAGQKRISHATLKSSLKGLRNSDPFSFQVHYFRKDKKPYSGVLLKIPTSIGDIFRKVDR